MRPQSRHRLRSLLLLQLFIVTIAARQPGRPDAAALTLWKSSGTSETCAHLPQRTFACISATQYIPVYTHYLYRFVQAQHTARSVHSTLVVLH